MTGVWGIIWRQYGRDVGCTRISSGLRSIEKCVKYFGLIETSVGDDLNKGNLGCRRAKCARIMRKRQELGEM